MDIRQTISLIESASPRAWLDDDPEHVARYTAHWDRREDLGDGELPELDAGSVAAIQEMLRALVHTDGTLTVFRSLRLTLSGLFEIDPGDALGQSWTTDMRCAVSHNTDARTSDYILTGSVKASDVDWLSTIVLTSNGEHEVRLKDKCEVTLLKIVPIVGNRFGPEVRMDLQGKTFRTSGR